MLSSASFLGVAVPTVDDERRRPPATSRAGALTARIAEIAPGRPADDGRLDALALGLVDALLEGEHETLRAVQQELRGARGRVLAGDGEPDRERLLGWLAGMTAVVHWALERATPESAPGAVAAGTQAHQFLEVLQDARHAGSAELRQLLETDETQVSRTGRRLLESGLVSRRKVGRQVFWELTPRGRRALELAPAAATAGRGDRAALWMAAIRRGFERGDEPGSEDPTRDRIVDSALSLHAVQGIRATTWPEIASRAGVPVETVETYFPTLDDLIVGCGQHLLEGLRLPPPDRAADLFAAAKSDDDRVARLVETTFEAYERGGAAIDGARRERAELPLVDEALEQVDVSLDALVAEALRPRRPGRASIAAVRALTDVTMWRALREQGASPAASVQQATGTVERWLEAHPTEA